MAKIQQGAAEGGTPLWKKLGLPKERPSTLVLIDADPDFVIPELPGHIVVSHETLAAKRRSKADLVVGFFRTRKGLDREMPRLGRRIFPEGALWIAWPRRQGGHTSDLTDNVVREVAIREGLVDVKVAALSNDWSGLRFVWRKELRS